jgi:tetratricopeptide (TPR) repeat protein
LNDRYSYSPGVLYAIVIAYGLLRVMTNPAVAAGLKKIVPISVAGVAAAFAVLSSAQLMTWQTPEITLRHILSEMGPGDPGLRAVHWQLGQLYYNQQRFLEGIEQCDLTLHDDPRHFVALSVRMDCLVALAAQARSQQPAALPAIGLETAQTADRMNEIRPAADTFVVAGLGYLEAGRAALAQGRLAQAAKMYPGDPTVRLALGATLFRTGQQEAALAQLEEAVRLSPELGQRREAIVASWRAAAVAPSPATQGRQ